MTEINEKRVLIVDDSGLHRQHAEALLRKLGFCNIMHAGNGIEALQVMSSSPYMPELLLVDLEMPEMDGVELLQQIMQRQLRLDIIVNSSRETTLLNSVEVMSQNLGMDILAALQKPLTLDKLAGALGHAVPQMAHKNARDIYPLETITHALEQGQFICHYQPKVTTTTGVLKGVEALARWQHPRDGLVYPDRFIDPIERHGAIAQRFTLAILKQVLAQLKLWHAGGLMISASVNIPAQTFADAAFINQIITEVEQQGMEPRYVMLEVTETAVMTDIGASLGTLARLRLKGFGLSIDDYGTGFASLQQLARIPATELKIDRVFVHGASQREHLRIMLEAAVNLAKKLQLSVVAEGVELEQDWPILSQIGCDLAQGYLVAKPMPADQLLTWIKADSRRLRALGK